MDRGNLEQYITQYLQLEPSITDTEILEIVQSARKNAILSSIPEYKPLNVADKEEIGTEYEERRKKLERKQYKDESTEEFD